jgi:hypothetical protein
VSLLTSKSSTNSVKASVEASGSERGFKRFLLLNKGSFHVQKWQFDGAEVAALDCSTKTIVLGLAPGKEKSRGWMSRI